MNFISIHVKLFHLTFVKLIFVKLIFVKLLILIYSSKLTKSFGLYNKNKDNSITQNLINVDTSLILETLSFNQSKNIWLLNLRLVNFNKAIIKDKYQTIMDSLKNRIKLCSNYWIR